MFRRNIAYDNETKVLVKNLSLTFYITIEKSIKGRQLARFLSSIFTEPERL